MPVRAQRCGLGLFSCLQCSRSTYGLRKFLGCYSVLRTGIQREYPIKRRDFILSISALSALAACGSPQGSGNFQLPQPQDGQGLLVIYRPGSAIGSGLRFPLTVDGMSVGNLSNGAVITQSVSPGEHVVQTSAPSVDGTSGVAAGG